MNAEHRPTNASTATIAPRDGVRESRFLALSSAPPTEEGYRLTATPDADACQLTPFMSCSTGFTDTNSPAPTAMAIRPRTVKYGTSFAGS